SCQNQKRLSLKKLHYKHIVTTKKSDSATVALKQKTWITIEKEFNAQGLFLNRTADQLKKRWENMLQSRKKEIAAEKQSSIDELIDNTVNIEITNILDSDHFEIIYADDIIDNLSEEMFPCTPKTNQHQPESTMLLKTTHSIKQTPNVNDILNDKNTKKL
ncbi:myb/SANT-like DNA-binding domain-containing protein 3, partial [Aphis craccivora]